MLRTPTDPVRSPAYRMGALVLFAATAVILVALAFEHVGGYLPCPLCLQQRYAYYLAIPLLFLALVLVGAERERMAALVFAAVGIAFLGNAGLGVYQAGAEWGYWAGPASCAATNAPLSTSAGGLLKDLATTRVARCDVALWRFLGLSFAGWNVVACIMLGAGAFSAALSALRGRG